MTAHSPYADLCREIKANGKATLPTAVEDMGYIAAMIAARIAAREAVTHCRVSFGDAGAMEAAHKLAAWVLALPPHKRAVIEQWLIRPKSSGR